MRPALRRILPVTVWLIAMLPAAWTIQRLPERTPYDIVPFLFEHTGFWAIVFLCATLTCSPLRQILGWRWPMRVRRSLGLITFAYATAHLYAYVVVGQHVRVDLMLGDARERLLIVMGWVAYLLLIPLAITSESRIARKLGHKRWSRLHRLVYVSLLAATWHFVKASDPHGPQWPQRCAYVAAALLTWRLIYGVWAGMHAK